MGSGWNYRVIYHPSYKHMVGETEFDSDEYYAVHEVYYNDEGKPDMYAIDSIIHGDTVKELKDIWDLINTGIKKDVINISFFEKTLDWEV